MLQFTDSTGHIICGDDFVGANQTIDAFLKHLVKEDEAQARHHNNIWREAISKQDLKKLFSNFYSESYTKP